VCVVHIYSLSSGLHALYSIAILAAAPRRPLLAQVLPRIRAGGIRENSAVGLVLGYTIDSQGYFKDISCQHLRRMMMIWRDFQCCTRRLLSIGHGSCRAARWFDVEFYNPRVAVRMHCCRQPMAFASQHQLPVPAFAKVAQKHHKHPRSCRSQCSRHCEKGTRCIDAAMASNAKPTRCVTSLHQSAPITTPSWQRQS
jgi:hypothetical protein